MERRTRAAELAVRGRLPAVELPAMALREVGEAAAEARDVVAAHAEVPRGADRPGLLLAGGLEGDDVVARVLELAARRLGLRLGREGEVDPHLVGLGEVGAVLLERLQDLDVVLLGRLALGQDLELRLLVDSHVPHSPHHGGRTTLESRMVAACRSWTSSTSSRTRSRTTPKSSGTEPSSCWRPTLGSTPSRSSSCCARSSRCCCATTWRS